MNRQAVRMPRSEFEAIRGERGLPAVFEHLWVTGSLDGLSRTTVAIVGTRAATAYGKGIAKRFAADLAAAGCCIISGLALGIDAAAHEGTLEAGAPAIGVLGGGHNCFFPPKNAALAQRMLDADGAVLSPYPPDQPAFPSQFLERNGVVAALADAIVVIEAPIRSGALNTAGWAAGRIPVYAVPGDIDRPHVAGCHALIRDGAILARSARDVIDDLHLRAPVAPPAPKRTTATKSADPLQREILKALHEGELHFDELLRRSAAPAHALMAALSMLEMSGHIEARPGMRYALRG